MSYVSNALQRSVIEGHWVSGGLAPLKSVW
jgi:hypothetical protein